eukprot:1394051-Amphidinium_carterae.1
MGSKTQESMQCLTSCQLRNCAFRNGVRFNCWLVEYFIAVVVGFVICICQCTVLLVKTCAPPCHANRDEFVHRFLQGAAPAESAPYMTFRKRCKVSVISNKHKADNGTIGMVIL